MSPVHILWSNTVRCSRRAAVDEAAQQHLLLSDFYALTIQPSVSLANLPQLAVDIILTSLNLRPVGVVGNGTTVAPFVGAGENGGIVTGGLTCELPSPCRNPCACVRGRRADERQCMAEQRAISSSCNSGLLC